MKLMRAACALTLSAVALTSFGTVGTTGEASAAPMPAAAFYAAPSQVPDVAGTVIRSEPMQLATTIPLINGPWPGTAQRVMYSSRLQDGRATAVTGTYLAPSRPWTGKGPQPTVIIGPGTVGQGDQCAPSKNFPLGFQITGQPALPLPASFSLNYEILNANAWNAAGARVFMTDYIGLGTPGTHTYVNRAEEGHAMLDAARAANQLAGTGNATPVAFWGYSQGGGAAASAAELASSYAPEINVRATFAGAPPADLFATLAKIDGNLIGGAIGFALNGFLERTPSLKSEVEKRLTPSGIAALGQISKSCIADLILQKPFWRTDTITRDHRPILANLRQIPAAVQLLNDQKIGRLKPNAPVLIVSGRNDDTVPYPQARQLAVDWCKQGAAVDFITDELPPILPGMVVNHAVPLLLDSYRPGGAMQFVADRLNGTPLNKCAIN